MFLLKNKLKNDVEIISGGAKGADYLGERFAKENGYNLRIFKANWNKYGKKLVPLEIQKWLNMLMHLLRFGMASQRELLI